MRTALLVVAAALLPLPCFAHAVVDLGVRFAAPEFVAASSTASIDTIVEGFAYDSAYGVTVDIEINDARVTSADPVWRCLTSSSSIQCSAEELTAGPHPIHIDVKVPAASTLHANATVASLGSFDPNAANNVATLESRIYNPAQCTPSAPQILGSDFRWTEVTGATIYEIYYGIDAETPHLAMRTNATQVALSVPGGDVTWFVRARFDACPALDSATSSFVSIAAPMKLTIATAWQEGLMTPQSVAVDGSIIVIADGAAKKLYTFDPAAPGLTQLPIYGDVVTSPPAFDGGIAVGPGDYLYDADRGTHSVRFALSPQRYMYFAAGQPKNAGTVDGQGNVARFDAPAAIAVAPTGTFYITDSTSNVVRRMQYNSAIFDFNVITFAGIPSQSGFADGRGATVRFNDPDGVVLDSTGNIYVCDRGNHVIRKITTDGTVSTIAGKAGVAGHIDGDRSTAMLDRPAGIALDAYGNFYVTEEGNHDVRKIAPNGRVTTVATGFDTPGLLAIAPDGTLWIPDAGSGRLVHAAPSAVERRRAVKR